MKYWDAGEKCMMKTQLLLFNIYIIRIIKSMRIRWARNVAGMGRIKIAYKILVQ
jgi:hypothetical protein